MDYFTAEEEAALRNSPIGPLRQALHQLLCEKREAANRATQHVIDSVQRLNDLEDDGGQMFPPGTMAEMQRIELILRETGENGLAALKFATKAPYPLAALQAQAQAIGPAATPPAGYCDHPIAGGPLGGKDVVRIPISVRDVLLKEYSKPSEAAGKTVADWLQTRDYKSRLDYGIAKMRELGVIR